MQKIKMDYLLTIILISLIGFGFSVNYSANSAVSLHNYGYMNYFLYRQIIFYALGIVIMFIVAKIRYQNLRGLIWLINLVTIGLLILSYIPAFQVQSNGADRWVRLFGIQFQPSEIAKITIIITLSHIIDIERRTGNLNKIKLKREFPFFELKGLNLIIVYLCMYIGLILMQKHLSATGIVVIVSMCLLLIGGLKGIYFGILGIAGGFLGVIAVIQEPYRLSRIVGFMHPEKNMAKEGYQIMESWYGLGSGEWFGLGLGMSRQKFTWLPENHTDFIVGVIGEEIGFIGIVIMMIIFLALLLRGLTLSVQAPDYFGKSLVAGIILLIFSQFVINLAVVSGLFPVTGMPLPFVSYGGSDTIVLFIGLGLVYSVTSQIKVEQEKK